MKFKIPPVLVLFLAGVLAFLISRAFPFGFFYFYGCSIVALLISFLGICIALYAVFQFFKRKTTIDPRKPEKTSVLVTNGLYAYSRNPMYAAMLFFLVGWTLSLQNIFGFLACLFFVVYMNIFQIISEEKMLQSKFGKEYTDYCIAVRRWL